MKDNELANRLIELRKRKGFSQEFLAEESGISLRTIQRIEKGETQPRGDTLQRIAKGLGVTSEELIDWKLEKNSSYLVLLNTSALSFLFFPILGVLIPLVMWVSKKNNVHKVDEVGKEVVNFQITWCLFIFLFYLLIFVRIIFDISISLRLNPLVITAYFVILYILNVTLIVYNSIRIKKSKSPKYVLRIPFLR
ncbi:helix-turn-helix domain-containing protein [Salegentibacter maritimus]|uniref:Helix-turn-helix domain-containing protein n=1 Tax=Salegentibacter maritimus TaxID=2794347 RepID=A0ABS0TDG1_9FLAO|nr:helix-turn-helix domain-containing protein [Salegentibacter maritimus]MBI6119086.1 helix-turn-helix domain-containing protein [Salegentibacter maritimus]